MTRYRGIIWFKNGTCRKTGSTNDRRQAERMASDYFDQEMRHCTSDYSRPTRYEVVEEDD